MRRKAVDVAVVIALQEEFDILGRIFGPVVHQENRGRYTVHHFCYQASDGGKHSLIAACTGQMGNQESRALTKQLLDCYAPKLVVCIGISGNLSGDTAVGDVVIASEVDEFLYRAKVAGNDANQPILWDELQFGGRGFNSEPDLVTFMREFSSTHDAVVCEWRDAARRDTPPIIVRKGKEQRLSLEPGQPRIAVGAIASSDLVVASNDFRDKLLSRNRNYLAVDMEAFGVLAAVAEVPQNDRPASLVVRGLSDNADPKKSKLEARSRGRFRAWAMSNSALLLKRVLQSRQYSASSNVADPVDRLHERVRQISLPLHFANADFSDAELRARTSSLFSLICGSDRFTGDKEGLFDEVAKWVDHSTTLCGRVEGTAGTGKTSFLSALYLYQRARFCSAQSKYLPVLFDLHRYARPDGNRDGHASERQIRLQIEQDLAVLKQAVSQSPALRFLLIVDGADAVVPGCRCLSTTLASFAGTQHKVIVGCRPMAASPASDSSLPPHAPLKPTETLLRVGSFAVDGQIVAALKAIDPATPDEVCHKIVQSLHRFEALHVDLFTLAKLHEYCSLPDSPIIPRLSVVLDAYCRQRLEKLGGTPQAEDSDLLAVAAEQAFRRFVRYADRPAEMSPFNVEFEFLYSHTLIRDFLVAYHVIHSIASSKGTPDPLSFVYPKGVNCFCKELLTQDSNTEEKVFDTIARALRAGKLKKMAYAVYLAGRFTGDQRKRDAKQLLLDAKMQLKEPLPAERSLYALVRRGISISLTYLGDVREQQAYIARLLRDPSEDELNRGFHLEYYGDIQYDPRRPLQNKDSLEAFDHTYDYLRRRMRHCQEDHLLELDVYTVCSLAQQRHARGKLDGKLAAELCGLLDELFKFGRIRNPELCDYVQMIREHLVIKDFSVVTLLRQLYEIKDQKRRGWVVKNVAAPESVADHSFGAYLLALLFLPSCTNDGTYDKRTVLDMLLIHDLAEAITGDKLPREKDEEYHKKELKIFGDIKLWSTYADMADLREVATLWREFDAGETLNARIARDIDKLENLLQLGVYTQRGIAIADAGKWRDDLRAEVRTEEGQRIRDMLLLRVFTCTVEPSQPE